MGILFKPELAALVMAGKKTQTRRLAKPIDQDLTYPVDGFPVQQVSGASIQVLPLPTAKTARITAVKRGERYQWQTGKDYAVIPGMYNKSIGRIRITDIRREDVRQISEEDARAEGFNNRFEFFGVWMSLTTRKWYRYTDSELVDMDGERDESNRWGYWSGRRNSGWLKRSDTEAYQILHEMGLEMFDAWALTFEVVK